MAKETPAKETPAKETPAKETPAKETLAKETPVKRNARSAPGVSFLLSVKTIYPSARSSVL
jgi:hypothetical protein